MGWHMLQLVLPAQFLNAGHNHSITVKLADEVGRHVMWVPYQTTSMRQGILCGVGKVGFDTQDSMGRFTSFNLRFQVSQAK